MPFIGDPVSILTTCIVLICDRRPYRGIEEIGNTRQVARIRENLSP